MSDINQNPDSKTGFWKKINHTISYLNDTVIFSCIARGGSALNSLMAPPSGYFFRRTYRLYV